jgi:hypothetical protein
MIAVLFSALTITAALPANAEGYLFENNFYQMGQAYAQRLASLPTDNWSQLPPDKQAACHQRYDKILKDGVIDIRIAVGYFDWTVGSSVGQYGISPSLDIGAYYALRGLLTSSCSGNLRFCGFRPDQKNSNRLTRDVIINGQRVQAVVSIVFASATEYYSQNTGSYRQQQQDRSQYAENFFLNALTNADAVFYFGHARNGGGPDFKPPVFIPGTNKVDYNGYYLVRKEGVKKMTAALASAQNRTSVLGLMACDSRDHFLRSIRAVAPDTGVITSLNVLGVDIVYTAMLGGADSLLRGQCQKSFYQELRMNSQNADNITMDGMFE